MVMVHIIELRIICHVDLFARFFMILSLHCARVRFYDCYYSWLSFVCLVNFILPPSIFFPPHRLFHIRLTTNIMVICSVILLIIFEKKWWWFWCVVIELYLMKCVNKLAQMIDFILENFVRVVFSFFLFYNNFCLSCRLNHVTYR